MIVFDFFDNIFDHNFRRKGFSSRIFRRDRNGPESTRFETLRGIRLEDLFESEPDFTESAVEYEITLSREHAFRGVEKELVRKGKRLKVKIPANVKTGHKIKLKNALEITDGRTGDIIISIKVK